MRIFLIALVWLSNQAIAQYYPTQFSKISSTSGNLGVSLTAGAQFGIMTAGIGDVDDDGVNDIAVGATNQGGFSTGAAYILFMKTDNTVRSTVQINNTESELDSFGSSVCGLGDLDGDGVEDISVGANWDGDAGTRRGALWILFLRRDGSVKSRQKISSLAGNLNATLNDLAEFGTGVANLGDLNSDGVVDLAVGAFHNGASGQGGVFILFMNRDGTVKSKQLITTGSLPGLAPVADGNFGYALCSPGDINGDGIRDLVVGGHRNNGGQVWIFFLNSNGTPKAFTTFTPSSIGIDPSTTILGVALASAGDFNKDGVPDIVVGANDNSSTGIIWYVGLKRDGAIKSTFKIGGDGDTNLVLHAGDFFGGSLGTIGDSDGDGISEIVVGAFQDDDGAANNGAIWLSSTCPLGNAGTDITSCTGVPATMNATLPSGSTGTWSVISGQATFSDMHDSKSQVSTLGNGINQLLWSVATNGCVRKDTVKINVVPKPTAKINIPDTLYSCKSSIEVSGEATGGKGTWSVSIGDASLSSATETTIQILLRLQPSTVTWTVSNEYCPQISDAVHIVPFQLRQQDLPNVITPNGDYKNDFWKIKNIERVKNEVRIYDRWGKSVFETSNYKNQWSGGGLSAGVYNYIIIIPDCEATIKGTISIID